MDFDTIYNMILTVGMGAITFFLKRSFDKLDSRASHSDVEELKNKLPRRGADPGHLAGGQVLLWNAADTQPLAAQPDRGGIYQIPLQ